VPPGALGDEQPDDEQYERERQQPEQSDPRLAPMPELQIIQPEILPLDCGVLDESAKPGDGNHA
jgi:hypothetical protein